MTIKQLFPVLFLLFSFASVQAQKVGHLNSQTLLAEMPEVKQAESNLKAFQTQLEKKGQQMVETLQKAYQEVSRKEQQGEISPKQLEEEGKKLKAEEEKIQAYEADMQAQMVTKREELLQPILDRVNTAIADICSVKGYQYIIDLSSGVLLFASEEHDITAEVKTKLGL